MEEKSEMGYFMECVKLVLRLIKSSVKTGGTIIWQKTKIYGKYAVIMAYFATLLGICLKVVNKIAKD